MGMIDKLYHAYTLLPWVLLHWLSMCQFVQMLLCFRYQLYHAYTQPTCEYYQAYYTDYPCPSLSKCCWSWCLSPPGFVHLLYPEVGHNVLSMVNTCITAKKHHSFVRCYACHALDIDQPFFICGFWSICKANAGSIYCMECADSAACKL